MADIPNDGLVGLTDAQPRGGFGKMPNAPHQTFHGFMTGGPYELAIVEFDDQGRCYDRGQMDGIAARLDKLRADETDVIIAVFVHGWKHDARTDDDNLCNFRTLLSDVARYEQDHTAPGATKRPVLGIFVGWRGLLEYGNDLIEGATFWDRQGAGLRVSWGSVRELFGRLRHYRNHQLKYHKSPLLVIAGHSFGGMVVYSALAQSLIEAASAPADTLIPSLADLVLLINPAFEGERFLPIYDLISADAFQNRGITQLPVFVCAQANNDFPVGKLFPLGAKPGSLLEAALGDLETRCITTALGFVDEFRTHQLDAPNGGEPFVLNPPGETQVNPYWVVGATQPVINDHGGIWQDPFKAFLAWLVFQHVEGSKLQDSSRVKARNV